MAASLDGHVARLDGRVDWLETSDRFADGKHLQPEAVAAFLAAIDCYVMGSRTYETALAFEQQGLSWVYGDKPTFVLSRREHLRTRNSVEFWSGDLADLVNGALRPRFRNIWIVGGPAVVGECLRRGLVDEVRWTVAPILIGEGLPFAGTLPGDIPLHLLEVNAYANGTVGLRYAVQKGVSDP